MAFSASAPAYSSFFGVVTSPGYPQPYPAGTSCRFEFVNIPDVSRIAINFIDFDLRDPEAAENAGGDTTGGPSFCAFDFVDILVIEMDGSPMKLLQRHCGSTPPQELSTTAQRVIINFR